MWQKHEKEKMKTDNNRAKTRQRARKQAVKHSIMRFLGFDCRTSVWRNHDKEQIAVTLLGIWRLPWEDNGTFFKIITNAHARRLVRNLLE